MPKFRYYSPRISRFLVSLLYHEAKRRQIPMTQLTDELLRKQIMGEDMEETRDAEESPLYPASATR